MVLLFISPKSLDMKAGLESLSLAKERISSNGRKLLRRRFLLNIENSQAGLPKSCSAAF